MDGQLYRDGLAFGRALMKLAAAHKIAASAGVGNRTADFAKRVGGHVVRSFERAGAAGRGMASGLGMSEAAQRNAEHIGKGVLGAGGLYAANKARHGVESWGERHNFRGQQGY